MRGCNYEWHWLGWHGYCLHHMLYHYGVYIKQEVLKPLVFFINCLQLVHSLFIDFWGCMWYTNITLRRGGVIYEQGKDNKEKEDDTMGKELESS